LYHLDHLPIDLTGFYHARRRASIAAGLTMIGARAFDTIQRPALPRYQKQNGQQVAQDSLAA